MDPIALGLPHRDPFVFLDEVREIQHGISASALKKFAPEDPLFHGHFPANPIVPGVLLTEALAQLAGILGASSDPGKYFLLSAIRSMKFPAAALPDETIHLFARQVAVMETLWHFEVEAQVSTASVERIVASGSIILSEVSS
ncbi:MAG: 3-hydroxyacyl-ACP dehydratase FabZ family protein [Chthoniobacterales bacterium]